MYIPSNFAVLSVIMERFARLSPEQFIDKCFSSHDERHREDLLNKYHSAGHNIFQFMPKLDAPHMEEVNTFMNQLIKPDEYPNFEHLWRLLPAELWKGAYIEQKPNINSQTLICTRVIKA